MESVGVIIQCLKPTTNQQAAKHPFCYRTRGFDLFNVLNVFSQRFQHHIVCSFVTAVPFPPGSSKRNKIMASPSPLSPDFLEHLNQHGYVIIPQPQVMSLTTLHNLQRHCLNQSNGQGLKSFAHFSIGRYHYNGLRDKAFMRLIEETFAATSQSMLHTPTTTTTTTPFHALASSYLPNKTIIQTELQLLIASPSSINQPFHYDNTHKGLSVIVPLVNIHADNGTTEILAGSHIHIQKVVDGDFSSVFEDLNPFSSSKDRTISIQPLVAAGSAIIFDSRTIHRGKSNTSSSQRPVLVFRYDCVETPPPRAKLSSLVIGTQVLGRILSLLSK